MPEFDACIVKHCLSGTVTSVAGDAADALKDLFGESSSPTTLQSSVLAALVRTANG